MGIKIGDEVIPNCVVGGLIPGKRYKVTGRNGVLINVEGSTLNYHRSYFNVTSSDTPSPIRTRREIVPGQWGNINVSCVVDGNVLINVRDDFGHVAFNAEELREAAHILNQIAEVLEENTE